MESSAIQDFDIDEPLNELETRLFACLDGLIPREDFLNDFLNATLYILVDGELVNGELGERVPLILATAPEEPGLLAVFSHPTRGERIVEHFTEYIYPVMVNTRWALGTLGPGMGIIVNPGCNIGFEIAPPGAQQLKFAVAPLTE